MVGDADFKGIFNFKPFSPREMELSGPDTVLRMAHSESLLLLLLSQAFVTVAFKWHYSTTGWPNEGDLLKEL